MRKTICTASITTPSGKARLWRCHDFWISSAGKFSGGTELAHHFEKTTRLQTGFWPFDYQKIAEYDDEKVEKLMQNEQIVRNRLKILATINNARRFMEIQYEFGSFSAFIWQFVGGKPIINHPKTLSEVPVTTEISDKIAKELKKRDFKFLGF